MSRIEILQQEIFTKNYSKFLPNTSDKIQITCYKLQNNETNAVSLIRLSLRGMWHLAQEAVVHYKPGDGFWYPLQGPGTGQVQTKLPAWDEPGREYRGKSTTDGWQRIKKRKVLWELRAQNGLRGHWREAEHSPASPQLTEELQTRWCDVQAAPHWCLQDTGCCAHQQPRSPPGALTWFCNTVGGQFQALFSYHKENLTVWFFSCLQSQ